MVFQGDTGFIVRQIELVENRIRQPNTANHIWDWRLYKAIKVLRRGRKSFFLGRIGDNKNTLFHIQEADKGQTGKMIFQFILNLPQGSRIRTAWKVEDDYSVSGIIQLEMFGQGTVIAGQAANGKITVDKVIIAAFQKHIFIFLLEMAQLSRQHMLFVNLFFEFF